MANSANLKKSWNHCRSFVLGTRPKYSRLPQGSSGFFLWFLWLFWGFQHKNSFVTKTLVFKITTIWPHKCLILFQLNVQKPSSNARIKKGVWISGEFVMLIQIAWINQMKKIAKMVKKYIFFLTFPFFSNPNYLSNLNYNCSNVLDL